MKPASVRSATIKKITVNAMAVTILAFLCMAGPALADEGVVERTNVCRKGTLIIKTTDDMFVAATQAGIDEFNQTPWSDDSEPKCSFFAGESVSGDLGSAGTVTLANTSGKSCDYVIEGSGFSMQDAEQMLGCE